MSDKLDLCCCCGVEMPDPAQHAYVNFRYQVPGSGNGEAVLVAVVCNPCATSAEDPKQFPVVEALINAKIIRIENNDAVFTPKDRKDEPGN